MTGKNTGNRTSNEVSMRTHVEHCVVLTNLSINDWHFVMHSKHVVQKRVPARTCWYSQESFARTRNRTFLRVRLRQGIPAVGSAKSAKANRNSCLWRETARLRSKLTSSVYSVLSSHLYIGSTSSCPHQRRQEIMVSPAGMVPQDRFTRTHSPGTCAIASA